MLALTAKIPRVVPLRHYTPCRSDGEDDSNISIFEALRREKEKLARDVHQREQELCRTRGLLRHLNPQILSSEDQKILAEQLQSHYEHRKEDALFNLNTSMTQLSHYRRHLISQPIPIPEPNIKLTEDLLTFVNNFKTSS